MSPLAFVAGKERPTDEVRRIISAASSRPYCNVRIRAEWPRLYRPAINWFGDENRLRRLFILDPIDKCIEQSVISRSRPRSTIAMENARRHEEAGELRCSSITPATCLLHHAIVVVDGSLRHDKVIAPTMPHEQFAAALAK